MKHRATLRSFIAVMHDAAMAGISFVLSLYVRLGDEQFYLAHDYLGSGTVLCVSICVIVFFCMRLYRGLWRFASMHDMVAIAKAVSLAMVIFAASMFLFNRLENVPRSVFLIQWMLLMCLLAAPRFAYRALKDRRLFWEMTLQEKAKIPVLLVGATGLAEQFIQDMLRDVRTAYRVVGIIDKDVAQHHRTLQRVRIYGGLCIFPVVMNKLERKGNRPRKILIADARLNGEDIRHIMKMADEAAVPVARIPRLSELKKHFDEKMDVQPIALEDLLGRAQTTLDRQAMRALIAGKRVLVTGAGGSIGSELTRQIAGYAPASLILLEACEHHLYQIGREIQHAHTVRILGDVRDASAMTRLFAEQRPQIVFHAAALKHVPLSEENPEEAILTNVIGTQIIADACVQHKAEAMVLISTDKAVNPSNVMGATKRAAESYCQALAAQQHTTCFITVRFGNVLGSTGSVVPLFAEQIEKGGPVTVTHPEMTRYFMTIREAVELVLQAAALGVSMQDRREHIFVLDMGEPIKILDLAMQMIRLAGLKPEEDIAIRFTGLRAGEKLHEALFHEAEKRVPTPHASIFLASSRSSDYSQLSVALGQLKTAACSRHTAQALALLKALVPEFQPLSHVA